MQPTMPTGPLGKDFLESLRKEFPEEFPETPLSLDDQLHYLDQVIAVEEGFIDNADDSFYEDAPGLDDMPDDPDFVSLEQLIEEELADEPPETE